MKKLFLTALAILVLFFFSKGFSKTVTVNSNKSWSAISVSSGDNVIITNDATLTIDVSNALCSYMTIGSNSNGNGTLKFNSGSVLSLTYTGNSLNIGSGSATGTVNMLSGGTLNISGAINEVNLGYFMEGAGTINYSRAAGQTIYGTTYNNLILSGSGVKSFASGVAINGTLSIEGTATIGGSSPAYGSSSVLQYKGSSAQTISSVEFPSSNGPGGLTINNSFGVSFPSSFSRTVSGPVTLTKGNLKIGANTLTLNGDLSAASGYIYGDSTSSDIIIDGSGTSSELAVLGGLKNLTVNRAAGVTLGSDITVNGLLTMTSGLLYTTSSYKIYFTTASSSPSETTSSYILGTAVMKRRLIGSGTVDFLNSYIQGTSNIGYVTITRKTGTDGIITANGNSGIAANWDIVTSVTMSGTRGVTFRWPQALDNNIVFSSVIQAQLYYNNSGSLVPVGTPVNVSGTALRTMTITLTHFSQYTIGATDSPLPVTLSSFASTVNGRNVRLNWSTSKETNNSGFEIQRTEINKSDYKTAGFVNGKGNSNVTVDYSFADTKLPAGKYKYRLKQVDYNGNYEYYDLNGSVEIGVPGKFALSQNYPNPFNPSTKIDFEVPAESYVSISVFDASGREVSKLLNENRKAGFYTVTFNASGLSSGIYFCRLTAVSDGINFTAAQKMILTK